MTRDRSQIADNAAALFDDDGRRPLSNERHAPATCLTLEPGTRKSHRDDPEKRCLRMYTGLSSVTSPEAEQQLAVCICTIDIRVTLYPSSRAGRTVSFESTRIHKDTRILSDGDEFATARHVRRNRLLKFV